MTLYQFLLTLVRDESASIHHLRMNQIIAFVAGFGDFMICTLCRWLSFWITLDSHCFQFILLMFWVYLLFTFISYGVLSFCLISLLSFLLLPRGRKMDWFKAWGVSKAHSWSGTRENLECTSNCWDEVLTPLSHHLWPYACRTCTNAWVCMQTLSYRFLV